MQLGEPEEGHGPLVQEPGVEGGQVRQVHLVRVQGGARVVVGGHVGGLQGLGGDPDGDVSGAEQGGRVHVESDLVRALELVRSLQEEQERRLQPGGGPGLPGPVAAEQVHGCGGEWGRNTQEHFILHCYMSTGGGLQVGRLSYFGLNTYDKTFDSLFIFISKVLTISFSSYSKVAFHSLSSLTTCLSNFSTCLKALRL